MQIIVLIEKLELYLSFNAILWVSQAICSVDKWDSAQNMLNFGLGARKDAFCKFP